MNFELYRFHCDKPAPGQAPIKLTTEKELRDACEDANPGDVFVVTEEFGQEDFKWEASGNKTTPIYVYFEAPMIDVSFELASAWVRFEGGDWQNSQVVVTGKFNRISRGLYRDGKEGWNTSRLHSAVAIKDHGAYNRVDHNEVTRWYRKAFRQIDCKEDAIYNLFDHNYFYYTPDGKRTNGRECIQIASGHHGPACSPHAMISQNIFERFSLEEELISLKSNDNVVFGNQIINCNATITSRSGSGNHITANLFFKSKGIRIFGDHNVVSSNVMQEDGMIRVQSGDVTANELLLPDGRPNPKWRGGHPAARGTIVIYNQLDRVIEIGKRGRGNPEFYDERHFPAEDTKLFSNDAKYIEVDKFKNTTELSTWAVDKYPVYDELEVGPNAPDELCATKPKPPKPEPELEKLHEAILTDYAQLGISISAFSDYVYNLRQDSQDTRIQDGT